MAVDRKTRGNTAETAARHYLARAGLRPIAANAGFRAGELDLVMLDGSGREGDTVVFVEVRYRRSSAFGGGAASVNLAKRRKLVRAAQLFLAGHPQYLQSPCRFDVVEADGAPDAPHLHWIKDAFRADDA
ncbi:YraN family protein [Pseudoxanthomonas wuyuanensis]